MDRIDRWGFCFFRVMDTVGAARGLGFIRYFCGGGGAGLAQGAAFRELRVFRVLGPFKTADGDHHGQFKFIADVGVIARAFTH